MARKRKTYIRLGIDGGDENREWPAMEKQRDQGKRKETEWPVWTEEQEPGNEREWRRKAEETGRRCATGRLDERWLGIGELWVGAGSSRGK